MQALRAVCSEVETSVSCYDYGCACNGDWFVIYNDLLKNHTVLRLVCSKARPFYRVPDNGSFIVCVRGEFRAFVERSLQ